MFLPVLDYWVAIFQEQFVDNTADELTMKIVKKKPFQEDPTVKAPYILIGWNPEKALVPAKLSTGEREYPQIGGGVPWTMHLTLRAAPKVVKTADQAYALIGQLTQRCMHILRKHALEEVDLLGSTTISNYDWLVIDSVTPKIQGGDREWLSHVDIEFHQRVLEKYPFGTYVSELEL